MVVQVPLTPVNNQQQTQKPVNAQTPKAMNFTPKPIGVINPVVPSSHSKVKSPDNYSFVNVSKEKKMEPNATTGIMKATGAFLMAVGGLAVAGYLFQHKKLGPVTNVEELKKYISSLTNSAMKTSLFNLPKRKINMFFPEEVLKSAGRNKAVEVKETFKCLQTYISRFAQDGDTYEIKMYLKNPDDEKKLIKDINKIEEVFKFSRKDSRRLNCDLGVSDDFWNEVERIELDHKTSESFIEKLALKRINRENPVIVKIISPTYVDDRSLNRVQDWLF